MILVIGLILILIAVIVTALMAFVFNEKVTILSGFIPLHINVFYIFLAGAACLVLFAVGLSIVRTGGMMSYKKYKKERQLTEQNKQLAAQLAKQNEGNPAPKNPVD